MNKPITYGSVCSGIEAVTVAMRPHGWKAEWFAEIEKYPSTDQNGGGHLAVCITGEITHTLKAEGFDASEDGTGRGQPIIAATLDAASGRSRGAGTPVGMLANSGMAVRRLVPTECEALQGVPRNYTLVPHRGKPMADGPRYKALGNSMAVPVIAWIGRRIDKSINNIDHVVQP